MDPLPWHSHRTDSNRRPAVYKTAAVNAQVTQAQALSETTTGHSTTSCTNDPDLAAVVEAWSELPEAVRAGIVAMVKAAKR